MKSKKEIKDQVAKTAGFCDWLELIKMCTADMISGHCDLAMDLYVEQWRSPRGVVLLGGRHSKTADLAAMIAQISIKDITIICRSENEAEKMASRVRENIRRFSEVIQYTALEVEDLKTATERFRSEKPRGVVPEKYRNGNFR